MDDEYVVFNWSMPVERADMGSDHNLKQSKGRSKGGIAEKRTAGKQGDNYIKTLIVMRKIGPWKTTYHKKKKKK